VHVDTLQLFLIMAGHGKRSVVVLSGIILLVAPFLIRLASLTYSLIAARDRYI